MNKFTGLLKKIFESLKSIVLGIGAVLVIAIIFIFTMCDYHDYYFFKDMYKIFKNSTTSYDKFCSDGEKYLKSKEYQKSIDVCNKAVELNPKRSEAYTYLGFSHFELGNYQIAKSNFENSLKISSKDASVKAYLGLSYLSLKDHEKAFETFIEANQIKPNVHSYCGLGTIYVSKFQFDKALENFNYCLQFNTGDASPEVWSSIYGGLAMIYFSTQNLEKAYEYAYKSLENKPSSNDYFILGYYYLLKNQKEEALKFFTTSANMGNNLAKQSLEQYFNAK